MLNASIGLAWQNGFEVMLWGRNLTDDDHMTFAVNFGAMVGANFVEERSYGVDFIVNFN